MSASVPTGTREDWCDRQQKAGVDVVVCHPKFVETGLDLLAFARLYLWRARGELLSIPVRFRPTRW
jgi:hypothetical protein